MLTLKESTLVLAKIRVHHGNAAITDLEARTFHEELRADMTLGEALEAVKRFYAANDSGRWCGSGDVNAMVRRMRNESKPSEAQIAAECEARHLAEDAAWMYRRQRMLAAAGAAAGVDHAQPTRTARRAAEVTFHGQTVRRCPEAGCCLTRLDSEGRVMAEKFPTPQERAMAWLLEATEIGGMSRPETALYAYQAGFTAALDLCIEIETRLNKEETDDHAA